MEDEMALRLTLACGASDRTLPLILGDVVPQGIDLTFLRMYPEEVFWRMTRHAGFEAAEWQLTANLWIRGLLADDYQLQPRDMRWYLGGLYQPGRIEKITLQLPGVEVNPINADQTLSQMLQDGELEAVIGPRPPAGFPG